MTLEEFRHEMEAYLQSVQDEGKEFKDPLIATKRLMALYTKFDADERTMADKVIAEWVMSDDDATRYHARALIRQFRIASALPELKRRARRLAWSRTVGAPSELRLINRLIDKVARG